jgi:thioredoxin 1
MKIQTIMIALFLFAATMTGIAQKTTSGNQTKQTGEVQKKALKYKVTIIELGSVHCIPCQKMLVVMKSIEKKYGKQVKVVFHDVATPGGRPFGMQYAIRVIPFQIFLDDKGKEFFRHKGYFPEEELV